MYRKWFFEQFWEGDQRDVLYVFMPFSEFPILKFDLIKKAAEDHFREGADRADCSEGSNVIMTDVMNGIANSKMLLFDLSDDPKHSLDCKEKICQNVLYELGMAHIIREPEDIILIRKKSNINVPFDIFDVRRDEYEGELNPDWLNKKIKDALKNQEWHKSKRVVAAIRSLDHYASEILNEFGRYPERNSHFNLHQVIGTLLTFKCFVISYAEATTTLGRLVDLGIIKFDLAIHGVDAHHSYSFTQFGRMILKNRNIIQWDEEEFNRERPGMNKSYEENRATYNNMGDSTKKVEKEKIKESLK